MRWEDATPGARVAYVPAGSGLPPEYGEVVRQSAPGGGLVFVRFDGDSQPKATHASMLESDCRGHGCPCATNE